MTARAFHRVLRLVLVVSLLCLYPRPVSGQEPDLRYHINFPAVINGAHPAYGCEVVFQDPSDGEMQSKGTAFEVHWILKNTSASTWQASSAMIRFASGDRMHTGNDTREMPYNVSPDGKLDLTISMVAPSTGGSYTSNWALTRDSLILCLFYLQIKVQ